MIDTHCHLNDKSYDKDIAAVIQNGLDAGVKYFIIPATCPKDLHKTVSIANNFDNVYCAVGVHPHDASKVDNKVLSDIKKLALEKKVVAIGEIGLDYHYNNSEPEQQIVALHQQMQIAKDLDKPVIIHNRESDNDMIQVLNDYKGTQGVCHCFSSDEKMLEKLLHLGYHISFTANITFSKINMDNIILQTPMERLMLETDSPYMTPPPDRGKRNVPQNVIKVAEKISKIKNISINEVINMTTKNAKTLFKIPVLTLLLFCSLFLFGYNKLQAQSNNYEEYYEDEYEEELPDQYVRRLGVGVLVGTNTFVDRYETGQKSFSWEGLLSIGGFVNYRFHENLIAQVAYTYSKNTKTVDALPDSLKNWVDPNYHRALEISLIGMLNPRSMVNFYASAGATYFMNKWSRNFSGIFADGKKHYFNDDNIGANFGVGAFVNINAGSAGTFVLNAEWKLGFRLDNIVFNYDPRETPTSTNPNYYKETKHSSMSSVPRAGITWYIPWLK